MSMSIRQIKKVLREEGWRYTTTAPDNRQEVFIRKMTGDQTIRGIAGAPNGYPAARPGITYLVLCHDWDRRANARWRQEFDPTPDGLRTALRDAEVYLNQGYDAPYLFDGF